MAAMPHNIDKSAFRRGEYVGHPGPWRITRGQRGWFATHQRESARTIYGPTLEIVSRRIEHFAKQGHVDNGI